MPDCIYQPLRFLLWPLLTFALPALTFRLQILPNKKMSANHLANKKMPVRQGMIRAFPQGLKSDK